MATRPTPITDALFEYIVRESMTEHQLLVRLREETAAMPEADMQISPEQGQFMALLVKLIGARKTLEVGTFTGYSSTAVALALPDDGRVICCDMSDQWTSVARRYWKEAGVDHKIDLRLGVARDTLETMRRNGERGTFDFAFIDADKESYHIYYEQTLDLLRPGGLMMFDNMLAEGAVVETRGESSYRDAIRSTNTLIKEDPRVTSCLIQVGDGVTLAVKN
jgi:predicted O-methyltransferase YrrM